MEKPSSNRCQFQIEQLTPREQEVLLLLADERLSNQEIGQRLTITTNSVKWYTHQIYEKLGVKDRRQAVTRARELGLLRSDPPVSALPAHHLPIPITPFLGREHQVEQISRMLLDQGLRLVTLTGAGGVGKTRLAIRVAEELRTCYPQGVWLVELAGVTSEQFVADTVAAVFDLKGSQNLDTSKALLDYLRNKHLLLVLDNCEHLIDACAALVEELLKSCRDLQILLTSREALNIAGEIPYVVPSLSIPNPSKHQPDIDLQQYESARLFTERARAVQPNFTLTHQNAPAVTRICQKLDGIPLALELAAARLMVLDVFQLADRLEESIQLLTRGSRTALPRHKTMRASIEWSYNLLSKDEQMMLQRLAVFVGGWTLEAALSVCVDCGNQGMPEASSDEKRSPKFVGCRSNNIYQVWNEKIVDLLGGLVSKSLIQFIPTSGIEPRYRMLETIKNYLMERLEEGGGKEPIQERHLDYYLMLAMEAEPHLRARDATAWLDRLESELDNLRQALEFSISGSVAKGLQLATYLLWFWWTRSHSIEGIEKLDRLLRVQENRCSDQELNFLCKVSHGRAMNALSHLILKNKFIGILTPIPVKSEKELCQESQTIFQDLGQTYQRDYTLSLFNQAENTADFLECRRVFQMLNDRFWVAQCDEELATRHWQDSTWPLINCDFYAEENLALRREIGDIEGEGQALNILGNLAFYRGDLNRAVDLMNASMACFEKVRNQKFISVMRIKLSEVAIARGDYQEANQLAQIVFNAAQELNDQRLLNTARSHLVYFAWTNGDYNWAVQCCEEILELYKDLPLSPRSMYLYIVCRVALSYDKIDQAKVYLREFLSEKIQGTYTLATVINLLGLVATRERRAQAAAHFFGAQNALYGWLGNTLSPFERSEYEQALADIHAMLSEESFTMAWEFGQSMTVEQVIQYARETIDDNT